MLDKKIEKLTELQTMFNNLKIEEPQKQITDGTYPATLIAIERKISKNNNEYIQMTFNVAGYLPVHKRMMLKGKVSNDAAGRICKFARDFGKLTDDLNTAIAYLNTLTDVVCTIIISDADKEFYDVKVKNLRREIK